MSQFAASIAVELQCKGIDVTVVHPSPVASHFYNKVSHTCGQGMYMEMPC